MKPAIAVILIMAVAGSVLGMVLLSWCEPESRTRISETEQTRRIETIMNGYERLASQMAVMAEGQNNRIFIWAFIFLAFLVIIGMAGLCGVVVVAYLKRGEQRQQVVYVVHVDQIKGGVCSSQHLIR